MYMFLSHEIKLKILVFFFVCLYLHSYIRNSNILLAHVQSVTLILNEIDYVTIEVDP
jgi:hypothetical protein